MNFVDQSLETKTKPDFSNRWQEVSIAQENTCAWYHACLIIFILDALSSSNTLDIRAAVSAQLALSRKPVSCLLPCNRLLYTCLLLHAAPHPDSTKIWKVANKKTEKTPSKPSASPGAIFAAALFLAATAACQRQATTRTSGIE